MSNQFRILAIKPLEDCADYIKKNLVIGKVYYFYNGFEFTDDAVTIQKECQLPEDFFSTKKETSPQISIHAIVGKNGSGKSAVFEIIFRIINILAYECIKNENITLIYNVHAELTYQINENIFTLKVDTRNKEKVICKIFDRPNKELSINDYSINKQILFDNFFYTIGVNYSPYAYNTRDFSNESIDGKNWLQGIFHKNDGYKTPIVLLPYRDEGNININNEAYLAISRFLTLFVHNTQIGRENFFKKINEHNEVIELNLCKRSENYWVNKKTEDVNFKKIKAAWISILQTEKKYKKVYSELIKAESPIFYDAIRYLIYKTESIDETYADDLQITKDTEWEQVVEIIYNNSSHITIKIFQTLEYIKNTHTLYNCIEKEQIIPINEFSDCFIDIQNDEPIQNLIYFMPPPFLNVEIMLSSNKGEKYPLSQLSSGERQQIFSLSYILYHLRNIDSIKNDTNRFAYQYANIMVDEIELCYHPEMQRRQVHDLLFMLLTYPFQQIKAINIFLSTHSPIILSDIPNQNILFLDDGKIVEKKENTFAANIHTLYRDAFFLNGMPIGEFAKNKIDELVNYIDKNMVTNEIFKQIQLIGEPLLKNHLLKKYNEKMDVANKILEKIDIEQRIIALEEELKKLKEQSKNDKN